MDVEQLKEDVRQGRIPADRLIDVIAALQRRIEELERRLGKPAPAKFAASFSVRAEEQRQEARGRKQRRRKRRSRDGRKRTAEKIKQAAHTEKVFPAGIPEADCWLSHTRPVWRVEDGRAVLVAYEIYRGPKNRYGKFPDVFGRSEFGIEIVLAIAYQVYIVGLSFDKACLLMNFFQNLKLRKSQADALMKRLARRWEEEFDVLCMLLANSLVVHTDETGWSNGGTGAIGRGGTVPRGDQHVVGPGDEGGPIIRFNQTGLRGIELPRHSCQVLPAVVELDRDHVAPTHHGARDRAGRGVRDIGRVHQELAAGHRGGAHVDESRGGVRLDLRDRRYAGTRGIEILGDEILAGSKPVR